MSNADTQKTQTVAKTSRRTKKNTQQKTAPSVAEATKAEAEATKAEAEATKAEAEATKAEAEAEADLIPDEKRYKSYVTKRVTTLTIFSAEIEIEVEDNIYARPYLWIEGNVCEVVCDDPINLGAGIAVVGQVYLKIPALVTDDETGDRLPVEPIPFANLTLKGVEVCDECGDILNDSAISQLLKAVEKEWSISHRLEIAIAKKRKQRERDRDRRANASSAKGRLKLRKRSS